MIQRLLPFLVQSSLRWEGAHHFVQEHLLFLAANCLIFSTRSVFMSQGSFGLCKKHGLHRSKQGRGPRVHHWPIRVTRRVKSLLLQLPSSLLIQNRRNQNRPERFQGFISIADFFVVFQQEIKKQTDKKLTCSWRGSQISGLHGGHR